MSIRKKVWEWTNKKGVKKKRVRWVVDYMTWDTKVQRRVRALKTYAKERDAKNFAASTHVAIGKGMHVPESRSATVQEAGEAWLKACRAAGLEVTTVERYEHHFERRLKPEMGHEKLAHITVPRVRHLQERLREQGRSRSMVKGTTGVLGAILSYAQEHGLAAHNAVRELSGRRKGGANPAKRRRKLEVGVDIPSPAEVRDILAKAGRWKPLLMTAALTGLRASELRGLRWSDVDLTKSVLHVRQRADKYGKIGAPKSDAGTRTVPLTPGLVQTLREWKLLCPKKKEGSDDKVGKLGLAFPNGNGNVELLGNVLKRGLKPAVLAAGLTVPVLDAEGVVKRDEEGKPVVEPKYTGLHSLRHFFASWCINRKIDGGLELPLKVVQERLGHASVTMTADTYGHLFPRGDDAAELAAAEKALLGT